MSDREAWAKLRAHIKREQRSYAFTNGRSKDARMVFAALEGAYGGILRKMDSLEVQASNPSARIPRCGARTLGGFRCAQGIGHDGAHSHPNERAA